MKHPELFQNGYYVTRFPLPSEIHSLVQTENWPEIDGHFQILTAPTGALFSFLKKFHDFQSIEFILSIRDSQNEWEEDGIWHDDGSRVFSFSLSLSSAEVKGGNLGVRRKAGEEAAEEKFPEIPTPPFGGIILFLTGFYGFEHKIHQVTSGRRIVVAGWCT
jgi:hypothetical protein